MRRSLWFALSLCLSCSPQDLSSGGGDGGVPCSPACPAGEQCYLGTCIAGAPCKGDNDCESDTYCQDGRCVPYGLQPRGDFNPQCTRTSPAGLLAPQIGCEWAAPAAGDPFPNHKQVLSTPLVADFNFDGHLEGETPSSHPSIVIVTYDGTDGGCGLGPKGDGANFGLIRVLDGRTCQQQYLIPVHVNGAATPAIGDINGDGLPDIVTLSASGGLVAFSFVKASGGFTTLWNSHDKAGAAHNPLVGQCEWTGATLADLDNDGHPESLVEGYVYNSAGQLLDGALGQLDSAAQDTGQFAVVADVNHDGTPKLVTARGMWRWDKTKPGWQSMYSYAGPTKGYVAVADFGTVKGAALDRTKLDGIAEIAVINQGQVWIQAIDGTKVFGPVSLPGSSGGGPPTVGDFDHDGRPEFAAAGSDSYTVFDPDCVSGGDKTYCGTGGVGGVLWSMASQDHSSNITGSSLFDFAGTGVAEAIYADECFARIYDGRNGEVLFSQEHSSCTWNEYPSLADVEGNFRSQLLVPSNVNCSVVCPAIDPVFKGLRCLTAADCLTGSTCVTGFCRCTGDAQCNATATGGGFVCRPAPMGVPGTGQTCQAAHTTPRSGVRVFKDVLDRWVSSRPLWNEHTYSVTNINDNGSVPQTSQLKLNWQQAGLNNFRMNVQGTVSPQSAPDLTVQGNLMCADRSGGGMVLSVSVCNRGTAPATDGLPVTFYQAGKALCTAQTSGALYPAKCMPVSCVWAAGSPGSYPLTAVANDAGGMPGPVGECAAGNDTGSAMVGCASPAG